MSRKPFFWLCIAWLCVLAVYGQVVSFDYVWDDNPLFVSSAALRNWASLPELWQAISRPILPGTTYFRPMVLLVFAIEFRFFGANPEVSHSINLILHLINVSLVFCIASIFAKGLPDRNRLLIPVIAAFFYALNPALHEAVCWVSGRFDLLATSFVLLGVFSGLAVTGVISGVLVGLCFFFGLASKEVAIMLPVAIGVVQCARGRLFLQGLSLRRDIRLQIYGLSIGFLAYAVLRLAEVPDFIHQNVVAAAELDLLGRLQLVGRTFQFYALMTVAPFIQQSPQHPFDMGALNSFDLISFVVLLGFVVFLLRLVLGGSLIAALFISALAALGPVLNIIPLTIGDNIGHERFMTLPLAFFALVVAYGLVGFVSVQRSRIIYSFSLLWFGVGVFSLLLTVPLWRNDLSLWAWAFAQHPKSAYVSHNYANAAIRFRDFDRARLALDAAYGVDPESGMTKLIEGHMLIRQHKYARGLEKIESVLGVMSFPHQSSPDFGGVNVSDVPKTSAQDLSWFLPFVYTAAAEAALSLRDFGKASDYIRVALYYDRSYPPALLVGGLAAYGQGNIDAGDNLILRARSVYIDFAQAEVHSIKAQFLVQLCQDVSAPSTTCNEDVLARIGGL